LCADLGLSVLGVLGRTYTVATSPQHPYRDVESTMQYLKPSRSQLVRQKVNEIFD
jgi:hypothetical protein